MATKTADSGQLNEPLMKSGDNICRTGSCTTSSCPPCRILWTIMTVYVVVLLIMETFL